MIHIQKYISRHTTSILLGIIILIAILLRFHNLTYQSLWLDELCSLTVSMPDKSFISMYKETVQDVHPPLYQTLLWVWYHIFDFNEFTSRSFSAIISSLSVLAIFFLAKELYNKEIGIYAAIIASSNQFLIFYAQETRSYSLLLLLSILSYLYFIKVLTNYSKKNFLFYLLFTIALLYTHYFAFFLVATQVFVFIFFIIKENTKRLLYLKLAMLTSITLMLSLAPLYEYILAHHAKEVFWIPQVSNLFFLDYMRSYVRNKHLEILFLLAILFTIMSFIKKNESNKFKSITFVLVIWIIFSYALPYIRGIISIPLLTIKNTIIVIPAFIVLISYGIYLLKDRTFKITMIGLITIISLSQIINGNYYKTVTKQQWRQVLLEVAKSKENMPMYDLVYDAFAYKTYAKALGLDLNISNYSTLVNKINNNTMNQCFLVLDSHGEHISKVKALNHPNVKKVLEVRKVLAKAVVYAYNTAPKICLERYNGTIKKIDFNTCTFSKPYQGTPLFMAWSGSLFTPEYSFPKNNYELIVEAKGTKAFDEYAQLELEVFSIHNNKRILIAKEVLYTHSKYKKYILPFSTDGKTPTSFIISFINNNGRLVPLEDRDLFLKSIVVKIK